MLRDGPTGQAENALDNFALTAQSVRRMLLTEGHRLLAERMRALKLTHAQLAEKLGVSRQIVHLWMTTGTIPRAKQMAGIADALNVPMPAWVQPAKDSARDTSDDTVPDPTDFGDEAEARQ